MNRIHALSMLIALASAAFACCSDAESVQDKPRDLNTPHLFTAPATLAEWKARSSELRRRLLFSTGLWPMPEKTPLNAQITGKWEGPDFVVENVALETRPGLYLCGNLYRPKGKKGPFPAIANPHGHWDAGRMHREADVPKADPSAPKPAPGRADLVSLAANLAKQGHVVFAYDMLGYNDTNQVVHRKFLDNLRPWASNVSVLGLQTWNSIRVVDYLSSLPYVDKKRIGATGASGGGTQTFLLAAVDDRVKVSVPVNMVSSTMQGGCLCENGPGLRVDTDNAEIAALFAPKPQLLISCTGDWTRENPVKEYPRVREVYGLFNAADKVENRHFNYDHNYNVESREAMYAFFGKHFLKDANADRFREQKVDLDPKVLKVWTDKHPRPSGALTAESLLQSLISDADNRIRALAPGRLAETARPAMRIALALPRPPAAGTSTAPGRKVILVSTSRAWLDQTARSLEMRQKKLPILTLEINPGPKPTESQLWDSFFSTYNQPPLGDAVSAIVNRMAEAQGQKVSAVDLVGDGIAGLWVLFARAASGIPGGTIADLSALKGDAEALYLTELFAPGIRAAGGWQAAAVLSAMPRLTLYGTDGVAGLEEVKSRTPAGKLTILSNSLSPASIAELAAR